MNKNITFEKLEPYVYVTKLAGFEHSEFIQPNATKKPKLETDIPMVQGKNIRDGVFVEKYDWYISRNISDSLPRSVLNKKCILIPYVGSNLGEVGIFPNKYRCHLASNIAKLELINDKYDLEYLMYYFQSPIGQSYLFKDKQGSSQPNITMESIRNSKVIIKPIIEQKKIAKILSKISRKIENNNAINNNLLTMIDTIYQEFVFSERAQKTKFKVQNMFTNDLFSLIKPGVSEFDTKIYYATSEVNGMNIGNGWTISYKNRESRANMAPTLYSVWFAKMKNSVKHLFLNNEMSNFIDKSILSTGFYGLQCNELTFEYVASVIHNENFEKLKDILSHGATQQGIGDDDLKNIKLLVPKHELLEEYHNKTSPMFSLIAKNINENNTLIQLRNELLPLLMNGQATIDE